MPLAARALGALMLFAALIVTLPGSALANDGLRGARYPALSPDGRTLLFCYWGDIWAQAADGSSSAWRLTDHLAWDWQPRFSPDGSYIAFNSTRGGNQDVWVMPWGGGAAWKVTDYSGSDSLCGWSPDGSRIVFSSNRGLWSSDIWHVDMQGSEPPVQLTGLDHYGAEEGQMLADGSVVYSRGSARWWRKGYRGTAQNDLWSIGSDGSYSQITNSNWSELWPMLAGDGSICFVSEQSGTANLWRLPVGGGEAVQLTAHDTDGVQWPAIQPGGSAVVYEHDGWIYRSAGSVQPERMTLHLAAEAKDNFVQKQSFRNEAEDFTVAPSGEYAVFVHKGDLWGIKDPKSWDETNKPDQDIERAWRLTASDGSRERQPAFAADGESVVYASDADGDYELYVLNLRTMQSTRLTENNLDDLEPQFSPADSNVVFHYSGNRDIRRHDIAAASSEVVASGRYRGGFDYTGFSVSPDGNWLAICEEMPDWSAEIFVVDSSGNGPYTNITRHPDWDDSPRWSDNGRWLLFSRNTERMRELYAVELCRRDQRFDLSFLPAEDGEEDSEDDSEDAGKESGDEDDESKNGDEDEDEDSEDSKAEGPDKLKVEIDLEDIHLRTRLVDSYNGAALAVGDYAVYELNPPGGKPSVKSKHIESGEEGEVLGSAWSRPQSADGGDRLFYLDGGSISYRGFRKGKGSEGATLNAAGDFWLDRRARWRQMFAEGHRTMGQRFYDPAMHGVDWAALRDKYAPYIEGVATPEEFQHIFLELLGELNASHLGITMADSSYSGSGPESCSLGLEFDNGFAGPGLKVSHVTYRGPADLPGEPVKVGDILLSIDGKPVSAAEKWQLLLDDKNGRPVQLALTDGGDGSAKSAVLKPISYGEWQSSLLYREWEIANEEYVERLSAGRIGYIHIRGMSGSELRKFERELYSELLEKDALLVDVRFNPGGFIHEQLFEILDRKPFAYSGHRDEGNVLQPARIYDKPKALLINARSGSDAEIFPSGWRILGLGPIVGVDTYGAVIGTTGFRLIDGSTVRLPIEGWYELDGRNLELSGTPPDFFLDVHPADLREGKDAQLEKAVELLLDSME